MRGFAIALLSSGFLAACGTEDPPPVCPTGNCSLPSSTIVQWTFDHYPERLFQGDTCKDMGATRVHVTLGNLADASILADQEVDCAEGQTSFLGLPDGMYNIALTPLDANGASLVKSPVGGTVAAGTVDLPSTVSVNVPFDAWAGTFTGTFLFRLSWGGASCAAAVPPVATQTLELVAGGQVTAQKTDQMQKLDGTDPQPCRALTEQFAQYVENLPFGNATFHVIGKDAGGVVVFDKQFDTFVGAAQNNPTITFDVTAPPPPP